MLCIERRVIGKQNGWFEDISSIAVSACAQIAGNPRILNAGTITARSLNSPAIFWLQARFSATPTMNHRNEVPDSRRSRPAETGRLLTVRRRLLAGGGEHIARTFAGLVAGWSSAGHTPNMSLGINHSSLSRRMLCPPRNRNRGQERERKR